MVPVDFWKDFNVETQRAYYGPDGPTVINVPAAVLLIRTMEPTDEDMERCEPFKSRIQRASELAANGHVIDVPVDVWGWDSAKTMRFRRMYGYTSVPDATGRVRILVPPGA